MSGYSGARRLERYCKQGASRRAVSKGSVLQPTAAECLARIREILSESRSQVHRAANAAMLAAYWHIGWEIVEEEQRGKDRADYGAYLLRELSAKPTEEFGKGFGERSLRYLRQFYLTYTDRISPIWHSPRAESKAEAGEIRNAARSELQESAEEIRNAARSEL